MKSAYALALLLYGSPLIACAPSDCAPVPDSCDPPQPQACCTPKTMTGMCHGGCMDIGFGCNAMLGVIINGWDCSGCSTPPPSPTCITNSICMFDSTNKCQDLSAPGPGLCPCQACPPPPPGGCTPDCACAVTLCSQFTCSDGCGGSCSGFVTTCCMPNPCPAACATTNYGTPCGDDGCGTICYGTAPIPACASTGCPAACATTCTGQPCGTDNCGNACSGAQACAAPPPAPLTPPGTGYIQEYGDHSL